MNIPGGWKKVNALRYFSFYLPPNAWDTGHQALDEFYKEYRIRKMRFLFIHNPMGHLSYRMRERVFGKGFQESVIEIDGKKAYLFNYIKNERGRKMYHIDLYVGDYAANDEVELCMKAESRTPADVEIARKIFGTVKFLKP
jgi:hypothetical protein